MVTGEERESLGLLNARSGEIVLLSEPDAWFAYSFWLDDRQVLFHAVRGGGEPVRALAVQHHHHDH